jgi:toxin CptA
VVGALLLLAMLAPFAVLASEMPRAVAWPLACVAAVSGLHAALREARRPARLLALPPGARTGDPGGGPGGATLDGEPLAEAVLSWRGPLAFLRWRDAAGRHGRLSWWPDTLPAAERRVLKLWSPTGPGMAP